MKVLNREIRKGNYWRFIAIYKIPKGLSKESKKIPSENNFGIIRI